MSIPFRFGIDDLDYLVTGGDDRAAHHPSARPWTGAIVGPDGCGKSILSLALASQYWNTHHCEAESNCHVLYVSTDLSHDQACTQWSNFGFDYPEARRAAIIAAYERPSRVFDPTADKGCKCSLRLLSPADDGALVEFAKSTGDAVHFLDLHSYTTGDDWGYVNRLLGLFDPVVHADHRHLLVLDAVEGLEALVGDVDAFGLKRTRRSRVAQIVRSAISANAHLMFVVEAAKGDIRLPEQFVTDLVIRLRARRRRGYSQRTIEIEKCRATAHARGEHELAIRKGTGAYTGKARDLDDPKVLWKSFTTETEAKKDVPLAHVHVIHSLHLWNRMVRDEVASLPQLIGSPRFLGLDRLNEMLQPLRSPIIAKQEAQCHGSLTFVLGDAGTHKSALAAHFLAAAFTDGRGTPTLERGSAVLLTTGLTDPEELTRRLSRRLLAHCPTLRGAAIKRIEGMISKRILCRHITVRHTGSGEFRSIIQSYIREGQRSAGVVGNTVEKRRHESHKVHFVLDDWNQLLTTHPNFAEDPLLVPSLLGVLKREGLTSLIVSTQPGQPTLPASAIFDTDLRKLDETHLFTWSVPFFGERRVAISAFPARTARKQPVVYEIVSGSRPLEEDTDDNEGLSIDRHFALYSDVDQGMPKRVPLLVRLYEGNHPVSGERQTAPVYAKALQDTLAQVFPHAPIGEGVLRFEPNTSYDSLFVFAESLDDARMDHTLVFQVDEFWSIGKHDPPPLANLYDYWTVPTARWDRGKYKAVVEEDVYKFFQPHSPSERLVTPAVGDKTPRITTREKKGRPFSRSKAFVTLQAGGPVIHQQRCDRVPYLWDFGLMLTHRDLWYRHHDEPVRSVGTLRQPSARTEWTIAAVWDALCLPDAQLHKVPGRSTRAYVPWEIFLAACHQIAEQECWNPLGFDISTPETLHCLLLEMWSSLEFDLCQESNADNTFKVSVRAGTRSANLKTLIATNQTSLYVAFALLLHASPGLRRSAAVQETDEPLWSPVASREWYHTASAIMKTRRDEHDCEVLALPGRYSTRGDWSLAIAQGSRSALLGLYSLDLLTNRRMNLLRMKDGIGLPVRDVSPDHAIGQLPTAITSRQNADKWRRVPVTYSDICSLGRNSTFSFEWLWRSEIRNYDRGVFYLREWIAEMIQMQRKWCPEVDEMKRLLDGTRVVAAHRRAKNGEPFLAATRDWEDCKEKIEAFANATVRLAAVLRD